MCPGSVQKVNKMRNSTNMILLSFYGSALPDQVRIGPISLLVRHFVARSLQCFSCYSYGHGKGSCRGSSRCGNCSALGTHSVEQCDANAYCYHCQDPHQLRSRHCPRYRLEQDILQLANAQFISLGSSCRKLLYRQKDGTGAMSYVSLADCSSAKFAVQKTSPSGSSGSVAAVGPAVRTGNRFALFD